MVPVKYQIKFVLVVYMYSTYHYVEIEISTEQMGASYIT
jgi:hypothetical protein